MTPEQNHQLEAAIADIVYSCVINPSASTVRPVMMEAFFDPINQHRIRVRYGQEEFPEEEGYITLFTGREVTAMRDRAQSKEGIARYNEHPEELVADFYKYIYATAAYKIKYIEEQLYGRDDRKRSSGAATKKEKGNTP